MEGYSGADSTEAGRCWIFGSASPLDGSELAPILSIFMNDWQSHGAAVSGGWKVLHGHFLVVLETPEGAQASGCSIDSMKGEIRKLEHRLGANLQDSGRIFYRDEAGAVQAVSRAQFKSLAAEGRIHLNTEVFDTTLTNASDLRPGMFNKPLGDSWHFRLVESVLPRAA
jgi:hypothetical protein